MVAARQDRAAERESVPYPRGHPRWGGAPPTEGFPYAVPVAPFPFLSFVDIVAASRDRTPLSIETEGSGLGAGVF